MDAAVKAYLNQFGITPATRAFYDHEKHMYINGECVAADSGDTIEIIEPSTGCCLGATPSATEKDVDTAISAARDALGGPWGKMKPNERERILHRLGDLVEQHAQTIAEIETIDNGKAISGCLEVDVLASADLLHYMAGWATKIEGATRSISFPGNNFAYTLREPIGVVAAIVPWNWPFSMAMWKLAAPLAAGCTVVLKPAQQTPMSMLYFASLCAESGLPAGVVNILTGRGSTMGNYMAGHAGVDKVSFTGSTEVGRVVGRAALENMSHLTLELGGKSPMLAFEDADLEALAASTLDSVYFNAGQVCSAGSRLYVHSSVYDEAVAAIEKVARGIHMAPGLDPKCEMGPVISAAAKQSILDYIEKAQAEGARLVCGGEGLDGEGFFVQPTLFADCTNQMSVVQEEIFGPVLCVVPFDTEEQAVQLANDNIYGLAASIWTQDISRAMRLVPRIQAGSVWVNGHDLVDNAMPFGGYKLSGFGKDLGPEQLDHFLQTKSVIVSIGDKA